jgi:hypothetical protein
MVFFGLDQKRVSFTILQIALYSSDTPFQLQTEASISLVVADKALSGKEITTEQ